MGPGGRMGGIGGRWIGLGEIVGWDCMGEPPSAVCTSLVSVGGLDTYVEGGEDAPCNVE